MYVCTYNQYSRDETLLSNKIMGKKKTTTARRRPQQQSETRGSAGRRNQEGSRNNKTNDGAVTSTLAATGAVVTTVTTTGANSTNKESFFSRRSRSPIQAGSNGKHKEDGSSTTKCRLYFFSRRSKLWQSNKQMLMKWDCTRILVVLSIWNVSAQITRKSFSDQG